MDCCHFQLSFALLTLHSLHYNRLPTLLSGHTIANIPSLPCNGLSLLPFWHSSIIYIPSLLYNGLQPHFSHLSSASCQHLHRKAEWSPSAEDCGHQTDSTPHGYKTLMCRSSAPNIFEQVQHECVKNNLVWSKNGTWIIKMHLTI